MVFTRFGFTIKRIKDYNPETGDCIALIQGECGAPDEWRDYKISQMKADRGISEILSKIESQKVLSV